MKKRKGGIYAALAAVVLISVLLITNCVDTVDLSGLSKNGKAPDGIAYLNFNFENTNGRTIMPIGITPSSFTAFELTVTNTSDSINVENKKIFIDGSATDCCAACDGNDSSTSCACDCCGTSGDNCSGCSYSAVALTNLEAYSVPLTATKAYSVTVDAFIAHNGTNTGNFASATFSGNIPSVTGAVSLPIKLIPVITGTGTGTFKYNLTYTNGATPFPAGSELDVLGYTSGTSVLSGGNAIDLTAAKSNLTGLAITAGIYKVVVTIPGDTTPPSVTQDITFVDILHIYPGMDSTFTKQFSASPVIGYTVAIHNPTGASTATQSFTYTHGQLLSDNATFAALNLSTNSNFEGLFEETGFSTQWPLTKYVYKGMDLYAKWGVPPALGLQVAINISDTSLSFTGTNTLSQAAIMATDGTSGKEFIEFELSSNDTRVTSTILSAAVWSYDRENTWSNTGSTLEWDHLTNTSFSALGDHVFTIVVNIDLDESGSSPDVRQFSGILTVTVNTP